MIVLQIWILVSTIVNDGSLTRYFGPAITSVVSIMIVGILAQTGTGCLFHFIRYLRNYLTLLFVLNFITSLDFIHIFFQIDTSILGIDNRWIFFYLPWIATVFFVSTIKNGHASWVCWLAWLMATVHLTMAWSVGAMMTFYAWPAIWCVGFLYLKKSKRKRLSATFLIIGAILLNFVLISGLLIDALSFLFTGILDKDMTLSGRTLLWNYVLNQVGDDPLFGAGVLSFDQDRSSFGEASGHRVNHPHNFLLNIMYHGGVIAGVLFIILMFLAAKGCERTHCKSFGLSLYTSLACIIIASLADTLDFSLFYIILGIAFHAPLFDAWCSFASDCSKNNSSSEWAEGNKANGC